MFRITDGKGFHITFANGYTVSVQWGPGNYCDNRNFDSDWGATPETFREAGEKGSTTAEVAVWYKDGPLLDIGLETVKGWVTTDELAGFFYQVSQLQPQAEAVINFQGNNIRLIERRKNED